MKICPNCGKTVKQSNKFCNSSCAASFNNKLRVRSDESKEKIRTSIRKFNESLDPDKRVSRIQKYKETRRKLNPPKYCKVCNKEIKKSNKYSYCKTHWILSKEFEQTIGHNRKYEKGYVYNKWNNSSVYLLSSLEYRYYNYLENNNIEWIKPTPLQYTLEGKQHLYFPDFYLPGTEEYIEVKGYMWKGDIEKLKAVRDQYPNIKLEIINKPYLKSIGY